MKRLAMCAIVICGVSIGCTSTPTHVSGQDEVVIRGAAREFTQALKQADPSAVTATSTVVADTDTKRLAQAVVADSVSGRQIHQALTEKFRESPQANSPVGSDAWIAKMEQAADNGEVLQAGDRAVVGAPGRDGSLYMRRVPTGWKVELIPTLVAESGGRSKVTDPAVEYRFNVTRAINQMMLDRLAKNEFTSVRDYQMARSEFWMKYLTYAANGEDPHDKLMPSLPPMPKTNDAMATER